MKGDCSNMDALRISPSYTSLDWERLDIANSSDWSKAVEIVRDRLVGRFLAFANRCLTEKYSGFVVLSIDSLLAETIQQFRDGITNGQGKSKRLITKFLEGHRFQPDFDGRAREAFFSDIRCGLLHQAEAKNMWLIRRKQSMLLRRTGGGDGYILDVQRFHSAIEYSLNDYLNAIVDQESTLLRENLWRKMHQICQVRNIRGAIYEADPDET